MRTMILSYHCNMGEIGANELLRWLVNKLEEKYRHEANTLALMLLEELLPLTRNDILLNEKVILDEQHQAKLEQFIMQLEEDIPIQHILGWADFYGYRFKVNEDVLIPRQETEELVQLVTALSKKHGYISVLDIGTGSGCIAITLARENRNLTITAVDISASALGIAQENALALNAEVHFGQLDILKDAPVGQYDVIVSNPPYVLNSERETLPANVIHKDPDLALFVADETPLIFYKRITKLATDHLNQKGLLIFEINEKFGPDIAQLLQEGGFSDVNIKQDINDQPRFVFGLKN